MNSINTSSILRNYSYDGSIVKNEDGGSLLRVSQNSLKEELFSADLLIKVREKKWKDHPEMITLVDKWLLNFKEIKKEHDTLTESGEIYPLIDSRQKEIAAKKEQWRTKIEQARSSNPRVHQLHKYLKNEIPELKPEPEGMGGAYKAPHFYFKVKGEDICEVNNRKGNATALLTSRVRDNIALYEGCEREAATYESASTSGVDSATPVTILAIATSEKFSHISDLPEKEKTYVLSQLKTSVDRERLGSLQERIENAATYREMDDVWAKEGPATFYTNHPKDMQYPLEAHLKYLMTILDLDSYEDCNFIAWKSGETDGNFGNYLVKAGQQKTHLLKDPVTGKFFIKIEPEKMRFIKIDNSLTYPETNEGLDNRLAALELGLLPLSERLKKKIREMDFGQEARTLTYYGLSVAIPATIQRMRAMQLLVEKFPNISIREFDFRLSLLEDEDLSQVRRGNYTEIFRDLTPQEIERIRPTTFSAPSLSPLDANGRSPLGVRGKVRKMGENLGRKHERSEKNISQELSERTFAFHNTKKKFEN